MRESSDAMAELVLVGAGHAHVEVLRRWAARPEPGVRLTLIAREVTAPYSGRLPALIRGECDLSDTQIDLGPLAAAAGARLVIAEATALDLAERLVVVRDRPPVRFDWLSLDIGGVSAMPEHGGIPVKPIGRFLAALARLDRQLADGARVAVAGAGAAGTELALALAARFGRRVRITLVCDTADPLAEAPARARAAVRAALAEAGVELVCGVRAAALDEGRLGLSDGSVLQADEVLWATNVVGPPLLADSGLHCDTAGCVVVDAGLRSRSHERVFAAGDCAALAESPRPKAGVWAVRAGPVLAANLRRAVRLRPLRSWRPQARALAIHGLGRGRAVAWRGRLAASGRLVGWGKEWIDRRFLRRYAIGRLPTPVTPVEQPRVALDPADLAVVSSPVVQHQRAGVAPPAGKVLVQHASWLVAPLDDPFAFGRIAAAHALVGLHAVGAQPWTAAAIVTPPPGAAEQARADALALLQGAAGVLEAGGAALVVCETATGPQAALGLVLTGLMPPDADRERALQPGDALILTKPLGSGLILEGHRRALVAGPWLLRALGVMAESSAAAADVLRAHGATACAAVDERGVVGALADLLRAANLAAALDPALVPALPGARAQIERGVTAPAAALNRQAWPDPPDDEVMALLTDPQLGGGLLAGVPRPAVAACLAALAEAGVAAAMIGVAEPRHLGLPRMRLEELADAVPAVPRHKVACEAE